MKKDTLKKLLLEYQNYVQRLEVKERELTWEENCNYVFVGVRRAGKSYMLFQRIKSLLASGHRPEEILYFNFEDDRLLNITLDDLDLLKQCYEELFDCRPFFFLDEIQLVDHWEKFVRRLADQQYRVYVTGSNAKMLSAEIATTLGGRFLVQEVFPLSFSEYLSFRGIDCGSCGRYGNACQISRSLEEYFIHGGFPELLGIADKRSWLSSLFNKVFFGDVISRHGVRNDYALKVLFRKLAESLKQPISYHRLANIVSSIGMKCSTDTIIDYLSYMVESWIVFPLENVQGKLTDKESKKKYYFIDNGLVSLFLLEPETALMENSVAVTLRRTFSSGLFYYANGVELDFYVPSQQLAIQAVYSMEDEGTLQREVASLQKAADYLGATERLIVTKEAGTWQIPGVKCVGLQEFLQAGTGHHC